ncbi:MAG: hypothetical protein AAFX99_19600 [Myxococcota bacterium]
MLPNSKANRTWLIITAMMVVGLWAAGCASTPEDTPPDRPSKPLIPKPLVLGEAVQKIQLEGKPWRHHYAFTLEREGLLQVSLSWRHPDGVERLIVHGDSGVVNNTALGHDRLQASVTTSAYRGQYYIEIVPGQYPTTYDLMVELSPTN